MGYFHNFHCVHWRAFSLNGRSTVSLRSTLLECLAVVIIEAREDSEDDAVVVIIRLTKKVVYGIKGKENGSDWVVWPEN